MSQKKILIIEDDKNHIQLLREMLESNKYKILIALNGREGYEKCIREAPDVIILDILLPGESGFDILKKIKEAKTLSSIPVIILSNLGQEQEIKLVDLANAIVKRVGSSSSVEVKDELPPYYHRQHLPDIRLAKEKLGWFPITLLNDGLERTVEFLKASKGLIEVGERVS